MQLTVVPSIVILTIPQEAGLLYLGVRSTYIRGLQIGTQFCPDMSFGAASAHAMARQTRVQVGFEIEFFLSSEMYVNGWFFDIYIQGSKKVQL